ncbi:MAG: hypothetical protein JXP73_14930, partial [Deltaproteobacteria bacterium]|nr:hypothetical protein [Deltaproteobacteria bacterium]
MKPRIGAAIALVLLATCSQEAREPGSADIESARVALGKSPPSEVANWQRAGASSTPEGRFLQALALDEARQLVVMFGGMIFDSFTYSGIPSQETWEWSAATGHWTLRTGTGPSPEARSGAALVYDSQRNRFVLFGGRAGSGFNLEDTWVWEPTTGAWTNVSTAGSRPSARSQHAMVYEKSTDKIFLFGGGRSDPYSPDGTNISVSLGDAWELDPETYVWTQLAVSNGPTPRHDMGAAWDAARGKVVIFGGMQTDIPNASGVPKQDTWEWDPTAATWTERTLPGDKPSQRYGHAMAFDGSRGQIVVFGGWDINSGGYLNDLWDLDPGSGAWTLRRTGTEGDGPSGRIFASMVALDATARLEVIGGAAPRYPDWWGGTGGIYAGPLPVYYGVVGTREVWELEPVSATFVDRTSPLDLPSERSNHAMAYNPSTGKTYVFGGYENMKGQALDDLWEWNGSTWALVPTKQRPPARGDAGLAYDPARESLILFGGSGYWGSSVYNDTWEWSQSRGWTQLKPFSNPDALFGHGMVTDTLRGKILLFGGISDKYWYAGPDAGPVPVPMKDPMRNEVWEWDGNQVTWTNRTPTASAQVPVPRQYPTLACDEARQKLFLFDGLNYGRSPDGSSSSFWEWDTSSAGWALRNPGDWLNNAYYTYAVYDPIRRREILFTDTANYTGGTNETWELDAKGPTWYVRTTANTPSARYYSAMAFDSARGVAVLFGGISNASGAVLNDTWEYKVTGWGNGTGCTAAFAASCASGNCVDGVCCDTAACTGPCQSCNVEGKEGTCVPVEAGTEVPGSCADGQACDGNGNCLSSNGQACASASTCASGFCVDGVCCDSACGGVCVSCAISGKAGQCSPYAAGSDPQNECGEGTGLCKSTCDGVGACVFPSTGQPCATCMVCDGAGNCSVYDPYCSFAGGGAGGGFGGSGGYTTARGGSGGYT